MLNVDNRTVLKNLWTSESFVLEKFFITELINPNSACKS